MKRGIQIFMIIFLGAFLFLGCMHQEKGEPPMEAMYIQKGDDFRIFVDTSTGTPFFATIPEDSEEFFTGDIVEIYGNHIMLESYPGQYPGVTEIRLKSRGKEEDAEKYQELLDTIYVEPDPAEPPSLNLEYTTTDARVSASASRGSLKWSYEDQEGTMQTIITDTAPVWEWTEINDLRFGTPTDVKLNFSETPDEVAIFYYPEGEGDPEGEKEEIPVAQSEGAYVLEGLEKAGIYQVNAFFKNGSVEYGFLVKP